MPRGSTTCPSCGAPVVTAPLAADVSTRLVLDPHEAASGAGRYAIWDDGTCRPVAAGAQVLANPLHQCRPPMPR